MFELNPNTNICVTGGDGFLGRYLVQELEKISYMNIFVSKIEEYDLPRLGGYLIYKESKRDLVLVKD